MHNSNRTELEIRVDELERSLSRTRSFAAVALVTLLAFACRSQGTTDHPRDDAGVLHVRGLVVEDGEGRPRLLLGAPIPVVDARTRTDAPTGLVLPDPDGHDRLELGAVGGPQMGGRVQERQSPATGLMVNDAKGDERGGFGVFENGQVGFGLDYPSQREAIVAAVMPDRGMAGLVFSADVEQDSTRAMIVTSNEGVVIQTQDAAGTVRSNWTTPAKGAPMLQVLDEHGTVERDVLAHP